MDTTQDVINKIQLFFSFQDMKEKEECKDVSNALYDKYVEPALNKLFMKYHSYPIFIEKIEIDVGDVSPEELESAIYRALEQQFLSYLDNHRGVNDQIEGGMEKIHLEGVNHRPLSVATSQNQQESGPRSVSEFSVKKANNESLMKEDNETEKDSMQISSPSNHKKQGDSVLDVASASEDVLRTDRPESSCRPTNKNESREVLCRYLTDLVRPWYLTDKEFNVHALIASCQLTIDFLDKLYERDRLSFSRLLRMLNVSELQELLLKDGFQTLGVSLDSIIGRLTAEGKDDDHKTILMLFVWGIIDADSIKSVTQTAAMLETVDLWSSILQFLTGQSSKENLLNELQRSDHLNELDDECKQFFNSTLYSLSLEKDEELHVLEQRWPVSNAGLVLLSPWLVALFDSLHYLDGEHKFKSLQYKERAAMLLHYLVCAFIEVQESDLILNKVLVGLPMSYPLDYDFKPTKEEREEVSALLSTLISYWPSLAGTSIHGLQETFIQRSGLLERMDDNFLLRVENKTLDILMNDIPWSYNVVSCPWNEYLIFVEWNE